MKTAFCAMVRDVRGNIAMMFGLMLFVIVGGAGIAIDLQRSNVVRTQVHEATDAAVLAAARYKTSHPSADDGELSAVARKVFDNGIANQSTVDITAFTVSFDDGADTFTATVVGSTNTLIMGLLGEKYIDVGARSEVRLGKPPLLEIAMALDVTGSMNDNGKISALRDSARDLVQSLFESDDADVKIGVVPFAQYVNIGTQYAGASWLDDPGAGWTGCVGSRPYPANVEDADFSWLRAPGVMASTCPVELKPLSDDEASIDSMIGGLSASGSTYIPGGLFWAWQLLTPSAPFSEAVSFAALDSANGTKALILMTDGMNTKAPSYPLHDLSDTSLANSLTAEICANVKLQKIILYTIAFDITDATIKDILEQCATSSSHYFDAADSGELADAFRSIASSLRNISLSK